MNISQEVLIEAPIQEVWGSLMDPEILTLCIPGCASIEVEEDGSLATRLNLKIGPMKASFKGNIQLLDVIEQHSYSMQFSGSAGMLGGGKGQAKVLLNNTGDGKTLLQYETSAAVNGKIAQVGARLIDSTARTLAGKFFNNLEAHFQPNIEKSVDKETV